MTADSKILISQLRALISNPEGVSDAERQEIMKLSRQAAVSLETPFEMFQRFTYCAMPLVTARIAQEHNIFKALLENVDKPDSVEELSSITGITSSVLTSLLEYMSTQYMVEETKGQYKAAKLSRMLMAPLFVDGVIHV